MKRKNTLIIFILGMLLSLGAVTAHAGYKDALILVRKGKWAKAVSEFEKLVAENHAASQFSLGLIYHLGRGVPPDLERAYNLYKMSALQGHASAINNIGMMYLNGEFVEKNRFIAFQLFEKAGAEHAQAKDNLGQSYENGWGIGVDYDLAINFYQLAGDEGYKLAYYHLGQLHEKGRGGAPVNIKEAIKWYQIAGEEEYARGFYRIGQIYEQGLGIATDKSKALFWYQQAANLDYNKAFAKVTKLSK
ncbi:MAG: sel1 repeat family protein [Magnetovibrio sp.]|nr:sel1 repeat family protein [Magnetovibrio sp.]